MTQGEAVFQAVCAVIGGEPGGEKVELRKDELEAVHEAVFMSFKNGTTVHSKNPTDEQLKKYIPGLVNNWLRKDKRLNGNTTYVAKNPGSRSGSGDEAIKAMKLLLSVTTDPDSKQEIQTEIDKRLATLKAANAPAIDVEKLPEALRHLVQA